MGSGDGMIVGSSMFEWLHLLFSVFLATIAVPEKSFPSTRSSFKTQGVVTVPG